MALHIPLMEQKLDQLDQLLCFFRFNINYHARPLFHVCADVAEFAHNMQCADRFLCHVFGSVAFFDSSPQFLNLTVKVGFFNIAKIRIIS